MIIIKLGGSLLESGALPRCLTRIKENYNHKTVIIVPGGGAFANQVRFAQQQFSLSEQTAHEMAILAMQQMALLINDLEPGFLLAYSFLEISTQATAKTPLIWSPAIAELNTAGIRASWDISSDSLAAWLAKTLAATELILVKSAVIDNNNSLQELVEQGVVDGAFNDFAGDAVFKVQVIYYADL